MDAASRNSLPRSETGQRCEKAVIMPFLPVEVNCRGCGEGLQKRLGRAIRALLMHFSCTPNASLMHSSCTAMLNARG